MQSKGTGFAIRCKYLWFFIREDWNTCMEQRQVSFCFLMQPDSSGGLTSDPVRFCVPNEIAGEAVRVTGEQQLLGAFGKAVATKLIFVVSADEFFSL